MSEEQLIHCSFCGRSESECKYILTSPEGACICSDCVLNCVAILFGEEGRGEAVSPEQDKDGE